jgi:hypothetical protein
MTTKYSPAMRQALRALFVESTLDVEGVKASYWVNANTAAALRVRGAIAPITSTRFGLTELGAEAIGEDYDALIGRAHERALIDNANFRRCPLADEGCDFVAFGRPATPFGNHREITSDDQIVYHLNQGHIPLGNALFIPSIAHLTDDHRANAADFVEGYRLAKAHDARTGVGTGTSEGRCRRAMREDTPVYVEGSEGRIVDVAVLGGVKFHVTGVNLDGWYYANQITVYDGQIADVEQAREAALREYMERHPGGQITVMDSLHLAILEAPQLPTSHCESDEPHDAHNWSYFGPAAFRCEGVQRRTPDYAVSVPVDVEHCAKTTQHGPHAWSWLGPQVSHFCDGSAVEAAIPVPDDAPLCAGHPSEAEAILCDGRCADVVNARQELPELHGPVTDGRGHDIAAEADAHVRNVLGGVA